ncbi:MAG: hypothetical protein KAJ24_08150, partial [Candidatus Aenigmarchaeota archaeon]|nr:hypothetical protein [Candidatus Aenigmarchaeota archaeon]
MNFRAQWFWGLIGSLGYILDEPIYYVFFIFFLAPLAPEKKTRTEKFEKPAFQEVQQFRQDWLWVILVFSSVMVFATTGLFVISDILSGNITSETYFLLAVVIIFGFGLPLFFYKLKMTTDVRRDGIYIRFFPFSRKILFSELKSYVSRKYSPVGEYGGWGVRCNFGGKGMAYNVSGNHGVQLELLSGKKILIGSQKPDELVR